MIEAIPLTTIPVIIFKSIGKGKYPHSTNTIAMLNDAIIVLVTVP
jgi:hypothetical protein